MPVRFIQNVKPSVTVARQLDRDLKKVASYSEGQIKKRTPVVTGRLKSSFEWKKLSPLRYEVGTRVKYAAPVEYGTEHFSGRKMMRRGMKHVEKRGISLLTNVRRRL